MGSNRRFVPHRPETNRTRSTESSEVFDKQDAEPLGLRRVLTSVMHDLYGTKDVQDAVTASYVWMADQLGHISLGLLPTLLGGWIWKLVWTCWIDPHHTMDPRWQLVGCLVAAAAVFAYWIKKERQDFVDTRKRAGGRFDFNAGDIAWNIKTALLYFGVGGLLGVLSFLSPLVFAVAFFVLLWPALRVAFWWLRRKVAFQQAVLPYLYRLASFTGEIEAGEIQCVKDVSSVKDTQTSLWRVLLTRDLIALNDPTCRHLLISGPLRSGKTSLAVGIGTEFAFSLGIGRFLSAAKLMQLATAPAGSTTPEQMEYDDGRILWPWKGCDLIIVDDVDNGLPTAAADMSAMRARQLESVIDGSQAPLAWLGKRRSVWVLGNSDTIDTWRNTIAGLIGVDASEIKPITLMPRGP